MMNCSAESAESMPPIPRIGKPGSLLPIAETALKPIGLVALPETPPYVVLFSVPTNKILLATTRVIFYVGIVLRGVLIFTLIYIHHVWDKPMGIKHEWYVPLTLYTRRGSRGISDIPPKRPRFTKIIYLILQT
jgi:hypothetical protein